MQSDLKYCPYDEHQQNHSAHLQDAHRQDKGVVQVVIISSQTRIYRTSYVDVATIEVSEY